MLRKLQELPGHALIELVLLGLERVGMTNIRTVRRAGAPGGEAHFAAVHRTGTDEIRTAIVVRKDGREIGRERVSDLRGALHHYGPASAGWLAHDRSGPERRARRGRRSGRADRALRRHRRSASCSRTTTSAWCARASRPPSRISSSSRRCGAEERSMAMRRARVSYGRFASRRARRRVRVAASSTRACADGACDARSRRRRSRSRVTPGSGRRTVEAAASRTRATRRVRIAADPRLLVLEVTPPAGFVDDAGAKRRTRRREAETEAGSLRPPRRRAPRDRRRPRARHSRRSARGRRSFDPLFYCFGARERARARRGRDREGALRLAVRAPTPTRDLARRPRALAPPFVAAPVGAAIGRFAPAKELEAAPFTLTETVANAAPSAAPALRRPPLLDLACPSRSTSRAASRSPRP